MKPFRIARSSARPLLAGVALLVGVAGTLGAAPAVAQDTLSTLDGVYSQEQATQGKLVYDVECSLCHGPSEFGGRLFQLTWTGQPLSMLYRHISTAMPLDNPGGLDREEYVAVLAYILELNRYPVGDRELPSEMEALGVIVMDPPPAPDSSTAGLIHEPSSYRR